ncbi:unnamed protein product [Penicillium salamii]|uniref:Zn(2)-C6 fungal-type domain-containing protein n=1 Tax=Penicillium salamii TaxID=1612424 RepID=A0A9W4K1Y6_9EURO|nr:unnamed protein product [Penicillium salamii]CAG7952588.1 unnamed protein product [Penicillium salamii]CAG8289029.1 unnamed protein product [Penicillium salamii]CAG8308462.1 unnamed protein product [Penicillium salamii]CAG8317056.1 unnamed protein product [Penicillium salamii]
MSSRTASSSPPGSSPPLRLGPDMRPVERPEAQRASQSEDYGHHNGGNSRTRVFSVRPGSERKRRLTSTGEDVRSQEWGRSGGAVGSVRDNGERVRSSLPHRSVSMVIPSSRTRTSFSATPGSSIATAIDITSSPSPTDSRSLSGELPRRPRRDNLPSRISQPRTVSSHHVDHSPPLMELSLPPWQPDAEVSECPICKTVFSFWHRKHHCRKCGRVVCAACSPHRITIPRQFIVRPRDELGVETSPTPPSHSSTRFPTVVDLTGEDPALPPTTNPALGGGEEVRLCNPCVPDPNPNPLGYSEMRTHGHRSTHSLSSTIANSSGLFAQRQHPEARQERRTVGANDRPQFLQDLSSQSCAVPPGAGIRQHRVISNRDGRPVEEGDFCPVCRRRFPPLSPDHPIEARQAHTRDCIESYLRPLPPRPSSTSTRQAPPLPPPPPSARMLPFVATEKDCLGEDGQPAECTICMEDYEVGQTLARLECLCKFHKHCIVDWFERKTECPWAVTRIGTNRSVSPYMDIDPQLHRDGDTQRPPYLPTRPTPISPEYPEPPTHHPLDPYARHHSAEGMQAQAGPLMGVERGDPSPDAEHEAKRSRACEPCRQLKVRCDPDPDHPEGSCKRCAKARRTCIVTAPTRKRQKKTDNRVAELERKIDALTATLQASHSTSPLFSGPSPREEPVRAWSNESKIAGNKRQASGAIKKPSEMLAPRYSRPGSPSAEQIPTASKQWLRPVADGPANSSGPSAKPVANNEFTDMIDRDIIDFNTANLAFDRYIYQMAPEMPFVVFPPGTTMGEVRRNKPFLFLAVIAVSISVFNPEAQPILVNELYQLIAEKVIVKGHKSLELVQTIMVCAIWYMPPDSFEELKFYSLTHMAAVLAMELGLNRRPSENKRTLNMIRELIIKKPSGPAFDPEGPEARRTWVGCYFLAAQMAAALRRVHLITWQPYMDECLEILATHPDALPSDRKLKWWAKLGLIMEDAGKHFAAEDAGSVATFASSKVYYDMKMFEDRIAKWRTDIPQDIYTAPMIQTEHVLNLFIHESSFSVDFNTSDDSLSREKMHSASIMAINDALNIAVRCIHQSIDVICTIETERLISLPTTCLARTPYPVVCLIKMYSLFMTPDSRIGQILDVQTLQLDYYLDKVIAHYRSAAGRKGGRAAAKFGNIMVMLRNWFIKKRDQGDQGQELKDAFSIRKGSDHQSSTPRQDTPAASANPPAQISQCMTPLHFLSEVAMGEPGSRAGNPIAARQVSGQGYPATLSPGSSTYGDPSLSSLSATKPNPQNSWPSGPSYPNTLSGPDPSQGDSRGYYQPFTDPPQSYPDINSMAAPTQSGYPDIPGGNGLQLAPPMGMTPGVGTDYSVADPWFTLGSMADEGLFTFPLSFDPNFGLF